ncbi:MAG: hypothetical protein EA384_05950 [Spirochaetaceae bacterium]|nr:MAG: hypothetical protein EA384_05950 [Spirochaetaceae bacterium]
MYYTLLGESSMNVGSRRPDYPVPHYVRGTDRDRDQMLSQIGGFSPDERRIFHLLCAMWQPEIPYTRALARTEREDPRFAQVLTTLMDKLQRGRLGLVLTSARDGIGTPRALVLTTQDSPPFFTALVEEQWSKLAADPTLPLPTSDLLAELHVKLPPTAARPATMTDVTRMTLEAPASDHYVVSVSLPEIRGLLVSSAATAQVVPAVLRKLRHRLDNINLIGLIARLNRASLTDVKRRIDSSDAAAWRTVIEALLENRADVERVSVPPAEELLAAAAVMRGYIEARIELRRQQQLSEQQRIRLASEFEEKVRLADGYVLAEEEFKALLHQQVPGADPETRLQRHSLLQRLTEVPAGRHLPRVVVLAETALHRDHVYMVLLQRISHLGDLIRKEYVHQMQLLLQSSDRDRFVFFYSLDNWEADIEQRIAARDPLVAELLRQPKLVAEAVVHACRTRLHITDPREIKRSLQVLFEPGGVTLRPRNRLLALDLSAILEVAYARLGKLKQFVLRISGRLEIMRQRFEDVTADSRTGRPPRVTGRGRIADALAQLERGSADPVETSSAADAPSSVTAADHEKPDGDTPRWGGMGSRARRSSPQTVHRPYSRRQQESAWSEFEKNIRRKT